MAICMIRITSRPAGEAPEEIRNAWIGAVMPVNATSEGMVLSSILTHKEVMNDGDEFAVLPKDALRALGLINPQARLWWEDRVRGTSHFVFKKECCEVLPD